MYEIKSCGVTIDFISDRFNAQNCYDQCHGPDVTLYKFVERGKIVVAQKSHSFSLSNSKALPVLPLKSKLAA